MVVGGKRFIGKKLLRPPENELFDDDESSDDDDDSDDDDEEEEEPVKASNNSNKSSNNTNALNNNTNNNDDSEDDEDEDDEGDDDDAEPWKTSSSNTLSFKNKPSANLSSSEDEDDDDDDEEEEDVEEEIVTNDTKSRKRSKNNIKNNKRAKTTSTASSSTRKFFDEYAEASDDDSIDEDDDEDDDEEEDPHDTVKKHYTAEDIRRENMDEETRELMRMQDKRRQQSRLFNFNDYNDNENNNHDPRRGGRDYSVEDVAREIEERHRMASRRVDRSYLEEAEREEISQGGMRMQNLSAVTQQSLLPSVNDPSLWMLKCANGKEGELVYQIMNKCVAFAMQGKPLGITSVVAAQSKGRIYVESFSEPSVRDALQGIRGLLMYTMKLVPISDMTTVLDVTVKKKPVQVNDWVRLTRGHFKGDLALVRAVRESGLKCIIQCIPRIDLTLSDLTPEEAKTRRRTIRPPQKFFNPQEIAAVGKHSLRQRFPGMNDTMCNYFEGNYYNDYGYLLKEVTVGTMIKLCANEDPPTLEELQKFRNKNKGSGKNNTMDNDDDDDDDANEGSRVAKSLLDELTDLQEKTNLHNKSNNANPGGLIIGDTVEVIEGDLVGMRGKLISIDGSTVKVKPTNTTDLGGTTQVEFLMTQVKKYIAVGAHVKVTDGRYNNETGIVVAIDTLADETDSTAVLLTDMTHKEISVRISQLQETAEVASGQDKLAGYELHDLVVLSGGGSTNEVGVIVRVGREEFTVINNHGIVREARPEELRGKRNSSSNRAVALDVQGNQIRVGDSVKVAEGPHKGKTATIKRMSRAQLFLYSQTRTENAGIFVVRSRSCHLTGSRVQGRRAGAESNMTPFATPQSVQSHSGPAGGRGGRRDDGIIGKTVRIQAGNWKGYLGTVSDATPTHVQVELHSRLKKVMVLRERVAVVGDKFGATEDPEREVTTNMMMGGSTPFMGGATPMHGGSTPMHGGSTPMHGGSTPTPQRDLSAGGYTPSHPGSSNDDVWRPGGSVDRPLNDDDDDDHSAYGSSVWNPSNSSSLNQNTSSDMSGSNNWSSSNNEQSWGTWTPSSNTMNNNTNSSTTATPSTTYTSAVIKDESVMNSSNPSTGGELSASTMGTAGAEEAPVWFMERVCVQLKSNNNTAVIKEINNNMAVVEMDDHSTIQVSCNDITMEAPKEHDTVLVTGGADVGVEGELVCIDGSDAILKDSNDDFKIVDLVHLAKIIGDN